jgi:hypothetical protein
MQDPVNKDQLIKSCHVALKNKFSLSNEALSSSKETLSKVLKPLLFTLEVYKERSSVGLSLNTA